MKYKKGLFNCVYYCCWSSLIDFLLSPAQTEVDTYVMKLPDIDKFEERLRKAEDELGIKQDSRVPVTFERSK